jgi:hypothetical protein
MLKRCWIIQKSESIFWDSRNRRVSQHVDHGVKIRHERFADVKHPVSKIGMSTLGGHEIDQAWTLYDTYAEQGINTFDTARHHVKVEDVFTVAEFRGIVIRCE